METAMADGGHLGDREQFRREHVAGWKLRLSRLSETGRPWSLSVVTLYFLRDRARMALSRIVLRTRSVPPRMPRRSSRQTRGHP